MEVCVMKTNAVGWATLALVSWLLPACTIDSGATEKTASTQADLQVAIGPHAISFEFSNVTFLPAGVAAGKQVYFIGDPLDGRVFAYARFPNKQLGELPQPPGGFVVPFIMHELGEGRVGVMAAGGLPQIKPFVPANPVIYE